MTKHISKTFSDDEVKSIFDQYVKREITSTQVQCLLGLRQRRFFQLLKQYREVPENFTLPQE